jgi:putative transposase
MIASKKLTLNIVSSIGVIQNVDNSGFNEQLLQNNLSNKLWLPNNINLSNKDLSNESEKIMNNSWFSCEKQIKEKSFLLVKNKNNVVAQSQLRIKTIRLNPSKELIKIIKNCIFVTRALYNKCIEHCFKADNPLPINLKSLREAFNYNKKETNILPISLKETFEKVPSGIKDEVLRDFVKAYNIQMDLFKKGKIKHFEMKFRRRKNCIQETIVIPHQQIKRNENGDIFCFPRIWNKEIFGVYKEKLPDIINHDCRLVMKTIGNNEKFYLAIPTDIEVKPKVKNFNAVSLDPGVKIFQTTYDTNGTSYIIGENDMDKIDNLSKAAQKLRDGNKTVWIGGKKEIINGKHKWVGGKKLVKKAETPKEKRGLLKAAAKVEYKIKNKISDLHRKTAKFLCEKYDTVIIPNFRVKQMSEKKDNNDNWKRKIGKETTRRMINWGHFQFRQLLITKGEATGTNIYVGTEEYTSKTCGNCFWINSKLQGERELQCENCNLVFHRDINAARNIMILNWDKSVLDLFRQKLIIVK